MDTRGRNPGDPVQPCHEEPTLRARDPNVSLRGTELEKSVGYTSRGYVEHFLPDREVNLAQLNKALADVYGEPALRMLSMQLVIDRDYWTQVCGNEWGGNAYRYAFFTPPDLDAIDDPVTDG